MKMNYKKVLLVGFAFLIIQAFWIAYDAIVPLMLVNKFGMNHTLSGVIMALDNILAVFLLPVFGSLSDKCKSKHGNACLNGKHDTVTGSPAADAGISESCEKERQKIRADGDTDAVEAMQKAHLHRIVVQRDIVVQRGIDGARTDAERNGKHTEPQKAVRI